METLEVYYSEDTDPRFVDRDQKSVFPGSSKDNTVIILTLRFETELKESFSPFHITTEHFSRCMDMLEVRSA